MAVWVPNNYNGMINISPYILLGNDEWSIDCHFYAPHPYGTSKMWHTWCRDYNQDHFFIVHYGQTPGFYDNYGSPEFKSLSFNMLTLSTGWHHLLCSYSSILEKILYYIDGNFIGMVSAIFSKDTNIYCIGNYQGGGQSFYPTKEFRVWKYAFKQKEIKYLQGITYAKYPPSSKYKLIFMLPFDEPAGSITVKDAVSGKSYTCITSQMVSSYPDPILSSLNKCLIEDNGILKQYDDDQWKIK